ncbi:Na+/H+ antiporter NhaA [Tabrizicola oligotrophica]|uniref:Na(+)/H(+) antiporter NhaA n=1 Tax=Tabrizicola oligotrophica TaxID=2710650 RepID=A0A6M0QTP9_9RHOB|nr:Na+/H+ antiporter NhaA [Tabrizicola oligotrophica]NEY90858.1 Na+/H+ antiporter NhaA [Tabrizicola oligotrophica]
MYKVWDVISTYSLLLLSGAALALVWANVDSDSYQHLVHFSLWDHAPIGEAHSEGGEVFRSLTLHFLVNDICMAFFFAIAAKEVWEGIILKDGELRGKKAMTPLIATAGGMLGPALVYLAIGAALGVMTDYAQGWAIPTATDIAFSYLVGRIVFGAGHPAIPFLLLLAIADDAGGMVILAIFYPTGDLQPAWLLLSLGAAVGVYLLANWLPTRLDGSDPRRPWSTRMRQKASFWPYAIAGLLSWYGFHNAGIHPALGLLPIVPTVPHADKPYGFFAEAEEHLGDLLNWIEHRLKYFVEVMLFFFGLLNAGVVFASFGEPTWMVLGGLVIGKPVGIFLLGMLAARVLGFGLPAGMTPKDLWVLGCVAAIGFTVALFVTTVAFPAGAAQEAAKMGAVFSFGAAALAIAMGRMLRVTRRGG